MKGNPKIRVDKTFMRIVKANIGIIGKTSAQVTKEIGKNFRRLKK